MIKLAVAGSPISHSLSPLLHSTAYEILGVQASFSAIEKNDLDFGDFYFEAKTHSVIYVNNSEIEALS